MERNDKKLLDVLLAEKSRLLVDASANGQSAAMLGLQHGHFELTYRLLSKAQVDLSARSKDGSTLLLYLCRSRGTLSKTQDQNNHNNSNNNTGDDNSVQEGQDTYFKRILDILLTQRGNDVNVANSLGELPLHAAALRGRTFACQRLLASGADVEALSNRGDSALMLVVRSMGSVELINVLLDGGASVAEQAVDFADMSGQTDVYELLDSRRKEQVELAGTNSGSGLSGSGSIGSSGGGSRTLRRRLSQRFSRNKALRESNSVDESDDSKKKKSKKRGSAVLSSSPLRSDHHHHQQQQLKEQNLKEQQERDRKKALKREERQREKMRLRRQRRRADSNLAMPEPSTVLPEQIVADVALVALNVKSALATRLADGLLAQRADDVNVLAIDGAVNCSVIWCERLQHKSMECIERIYVVVDDDDNDDDDDLNTSIASAVLPVTYLAVAMREQKSKASLIVVSSASRFNHSPAFYAAAHRARQRFLSHCELEFEQIIL